MTTPSSDLNCGSLTIKYLMFVFNLIFFISGLVLIIIGGVAQGFFKEYIQFFDNEYKTPAIGIIILGVIILLISFFGCCGARMENVCMLRTFSFLLGFLLICEVAAGISIAILKADIEQVVSDNMNNTMQEYGSNDTLPTHTWDDMQMKLHCCGTYNYTDWGNTPWNNASDAVPDSCCKSYTLHCGVNALKNPEVIYSNGCSDALQKSALSNLGAIVGGAVGLALIQIIGILMSMCLVRSVKEHYEVL